MIQPKKELGQNFLKDQEIIAALVEVSEPEPSDVYLEIGAGYGALTQPLATKAKQVIAVEVDQSLVSRLKKSLREFKNVRIVNEDILSFLDDCYHATYHGSNFSKIIGSIPYQITSPLLHRLVNLIQQTKIDSVTLLVQKEVAEKICAEAPRASYLSNFIQTFFSVQFIRNVSRESFSPVPKVDGAIIKLEVRIKNGELRALDSEKWSAFLHQGFKFPRKMLKKAFDEKMLKASGINSQQRPQELKLEQWLSLYKIYGR